MLYAFTESLTSAVMIGIFIAGFIAGWAAELILGRAGFGTVANAFIVMFGAVAGLMALGYFGHRIDQNLFFSLGAAAGGGALVLILFAFLKRL